MAINRIAFEVDGSIKLAPAAAAHRRLRRETLWASELWGGKEGFEHRTWAVLKMYVGIFVLAEGVISSFF